ncbi:MAG: MFS transporter [Xanthobacteraceae bacterium]
MNSVITRPAVLSACVVARHVAPALVLFVTSLGVLIAQVDMAVVNLAVKHIGADLDAGVSELQSVVDGYNLAYASFLMTGGTLGDLYGRRRVFALGIVLFTAGSLVCGLAPNGAVLIAGRALTGLGAALELPTSLAILTKAYPDAKERVRAIGIWASCNGLAMIIGPTIGGFLVDWAGWRSIFLVIVPICVLALVLTLRAVPESSDAKGRRLDLPGQGWAALALGSLSFAVIEGAHLGWNSPLVLGAAGLGLASASAFLWVESGSGSGLLPFDLFGNRVFTASLAVAACMTFGMYAMLFLTPLYLQSVRMVSAFAAGLDMLPLAITFVVVSPISGRLTNAVGARAVMTAGMALMGAGLVLLALVSVNTSFWLIAVALLAIGAGLGLNAGPVMAVAVANVPPARSGTASGLANTARIVGATMGVAVLGAVFAVYAGEAGAGGAGAVQIPAMLSGLRLAYIGGAVVEFVGAALALGFIRRHSHHASVPSKGLEKG